MIIFKVLIVVICVCFIVTTIDKENINIINKLSNNNRKLISLFQNEHDKSDTLYRILIHIKDELTLLRIKECPEQEKIDIPNEIIDWIEELKKIKEGNNNGISK